ncbi:zinc finger protein 184-like [Rhineura floridana]|uniref:zinc finger protein 184-like n=1 Tax=Rhineura floridana TaxID=261503 RepID=UPI002AC814C7|nr:zinc finger protein 184-like [Rhineura floridana]
MAAEEYIQVPTTFEEVSVTLTEEKELPLDPYLFALSGNDIEQYCTMQSWLELQNLKPDMYLETEQGVMMPLSLVQVVEEFEIWPSLYQGDGTKQILEYESMQQESAVPLVRLQYNFMPKSEGDVLQGKPSGCITVSELQQGTDLETRSDESVSPRKKLSLSPEALKDHLDREELIGDLNATILQQEASGQPAVAGFAVVQQSEWIVSQGSQWSNTQDVVGLNLLPGNASRQEGHPCDHGPKEATIHHQKGVGTRKEPCLGPSFGGKPNLNLNLTPLTQQLVPSEKSNKCLDSSHPFTYNTISITGHQRIFTDEWEKLFSHLNLSPLPSQTGDVGEKPFKCPDCGKGFIHRSSIHRHQRLHKKENQSPDSEQESSSGQGLNHLPHQKSHLQDKLLPGSEDGVSLHEMPNAPREQCAALNGPCGPISLASEVYKHQAADNKPFHCPDCGKMFTAKASVTRHQLLHRGERPFRCRYCDKSYIQKSHLKRHDQLKHQPIH